MAVEALVVIAVNDVVNSDAGCVIDDACDVADAGDNDAAKGAVSGVICVETEAVFAIGGSRMPTGSV